MTRTQKPSNAHLWFFEVSPAKERYKSRKTTNDNGKVTKSCYTTFTFRATFSSGLAGSVKCTNLHSLVASALWSLWSALFTNSMQVTHSLRRGLEEVRDSAQSQLCDYTIKNSSSSRHLSPSHYALSSRHPRARTQRLRNADLWLLEVSFAGEKKETQLIVPN